MISVVMAYHNRLSLLRRTLKSISKSSVTNVEIIIVDDFSDNDDRASLIIDEFPRLNVTVIEMSTVAPLKDYRNPCVPFNVGFRHATGSKVVLQNPECYHVGDVLHSVDEKLTNHNYLTFHCFSANVHENAMLDNGNSEALLDSRIRAGSDRWYNHQTINPTGYHFTAAITKDNLTKLNGFDETFAQGHGYDDNEFLYRVRLLPVTVEFIETPYVIHQSHHKGYTEKALIDKNRILFSDTQRRNEVRALNINNVSI